MENRQHTQSSDYANSVVKPPKSASLLKLSVLWSLYEVLIFSFQILPGNFQLSQKNRVKYGDVYTDTDSDSDSSSDGDNVPLSTLVERPKTPGRWRHRND